MGRLAMQLSCGAAAYVRKFGSYDRPGCELKYETPVIAHTSSVREDVCIGTFDTSRGKYCINHGSTIPEGGWGMFSSTLEALFTEHEVWVGKKFRNAPRIYILIKTIKKDNI
jgi:hypothetical protein